MPFRDYNRMSDIKDLKKPRTKRFWISKVKKAKEHMELCEKTVRSIGKDADNYEFWVNTARNAQKEYKTFVVSPFDEEFHNPDWYRTQSLESLEGLLENCSIYLEKDPYNPFIEDIKQINMFARKEKEMRVE